MPAPDKTPFYVSAKMTPDQCNGAAIILCFIQDLFSLSERQSMTPAEIVMVLQALGESHLPEGLMDRVKEYANRPR